MKTPEEIKRALRMCTSLCQCPTNQCAYHDYEGNCRYSMDEDALAYIEQLEEEAKQFHARWVKRKEDALVHWDCSRCGIGFLDDAGLDKYYYCPHCGAKMDGGTENAVN